MKATKSCSLLLAVLCSLALSACGGDPFSIVTGEGDRDAIESPGEEGAAEDAADEPGEEEADAAEEAVVTDGDEPDDPYEDVEICGNMSLPDPELYFNDQVAGIDITRILKIVSVGVPSLELYRVALACQENPCPFRFLDLPADLDGDGNPVSLGSGQSLSLTVAYDNTLPDPWQHVAQVKIHSDDCSSTIRTVTLVRPGYPLQKLCIDSMDPSYDPATGTVDFGTATLGQKKKPVRLILSNCTQEIGGASHDLYLVEMIAQGDTERFRVVGQNGSPVTLPYTLPSNRAEYLYLDVSYSALVRGGHRMDLTFRDYYLDLGTLTLTGTTEAACLNATPEPLVFPGTTYAETSIGSVAFVNQCGQDVMVFSAQMRESDSPFSLTLEPVLPLVVPDGQGSGDFTVSYTPRELRDQEDLPVSRDDDGLLDLYYCHTSEAGCRICDTGESANQCQERLATVLRQTAASLEGRGKPAHRTPLARLSYLRGGPHITGSYPGFAVGATLCFYGDISRTFPEDLGIIQWSWSLALRPDGSAARPMPGDPHLGLAQSDVVCLTFDRTGDYKLILEVRDGMGSWSANTDNWVAVGVESAISDITVTLDCPTCEGDVNFDLVWCSSMRCCSPAVTNSQQWCNLGINPLTQKLSGVQYGLVSNSCTEGTTESLTVRQPCEDESYRACAEIASGGEGDFSSQVLTCSLTFSGNVNGMPHEFFSIQDVTLDIQARDRECYHISFPNGEPTLDPEP